MAEKREEIQLEEEYERGGGLLSGDSNVKPNLYYCPNPDHGHISSRNIDWKGTIPYCPHCGRQLEAKLSSQEV